MDNKPRNEGIKIPADCNYPSQLAPFSKKDTFEFGLAVAHAIQGEYFYRRGTNVCRFYTSQAEKSLRRQYAKGIQPMGKYYQQLGLNGDKSYLNLPQRPVSIIPKLVAMVCNGFAERDYSIKASAVDEISQNDRMSYRKRLETDKLSKPIIDKAKQSFGVDIANFPVQDIPETDEELELHMQLEYKPSIELSAELAIDYIFQDNKYRETTERQVKKDLTVLGEGWVKHRFVPARGVMLEWVDPEYKIQSYSEDPYYRDCFWHGEFKPTLISDVLVEFPHLMQPEYANVRAQLEYSGQNWYTYHNIPNDQRLKGMTNLLYFTYKTTRERAKKIVNEDTGMRVVKKGIYEKKDDARKTDRVSFPSVVEEIEFEGVYVLGTDILLKWEVAENMIRPKSNKQKLIGQYIGCAPNREKEYIDSLVRRMMDIDDDLQVNRLKGMQMLQRMVPDGYFIDPDGFVDIDLGTGVVKIQDMIDMLIESGSTIGRSYDSSGNLNAAKIPITELKTGGNVLKIQALRVERMALLNELKDVIGLNSASDASTPEKDALVGVQKMMVANSNVATRDILHGGNHITRMLAEAAFYRLSDVLKYSPLKDDLARQIGATATVDIDEIKDLHLSDFAIYLSLELDDEDRAKLEADLSLAVEKGYIGIEDKYRIMNIKNLDQAVAYLSILIKKRMKKEEERKAKEYQVQADQNIRAATAAEEEKRKTAEFEAQVKARVQEITNKGLIEKEIVKGQQDRETMSLKIQGDVQVAQITGSVAMEKQAQAEDRKDERTAIQATQQSKMKEQAQREGRAIDFEAEQSELDIFKV